MSDDKVVSEAWQVIGGIHDPCSVSFGCPLSLVEMGLVKSISSESGNVVVELQLTEPTCAFTFRIAEEIKSRMRQRLGEQTETEIRILGPQDVSDIWDESAIAPPARERLRAFRRKRASEAHGGAAITVERGGVRNG